MSFWDGIRFEVEKTTDIEHHRDKEHRRFLEWKMNDDPGMRESLIETVAAAMRIPPPPRFQPMLVSVREAALFARHGIPVQGPEFPSHQRGRIAHRLAQALGVVPPCCPCTVYEGHRR
jgi:hypothetical protein